MRRGQMKCGQCGHCRSCYNRKYLDKVAKAKPIADHPWMHDHKVIVQHGVVKLCGLCYMPGGQHISWRHCIASLKQELLELRMKLVKVA